MMMKEAYENILHVFQATFPAGKELFQYNLSQIAV